MIVIENIDATTNSGTTYVEMSSEKRQSMVSYSRSNFYPIAVYTTKSLSAGRTFKTWDEALAGYKNTAIRDMIETARGVCE